MLQVSPAGAIMAATRLCLVERQLDCVWWLSQKSERSELTTCLVFVNRKICATGALGEVIC